MARLYGRAGHLTDENGDFRPGQCKNRFSNQHSRAGKRGADPADRVCAGCGAQLPPLGDQDHCDGCSRALGREAGPAGAGGSNYVKPEPEGGGASAGEWAEAPWAGGPPTSPITNRGPLLRELPGPFACERLASR